MRTVDRRAALYANGKIHYRRSLLLNELQVKEVVASRKLDKTWQAALKADEDLTFSIGSPAPLTPFDESLIPYPDKLIEQALSLLTGYLQATSMQHADHLMKMTLSFRKPA
ncbi:hypothetical protein [Allobaculum sp. Allo2]|uniref:hypothetical protein n=1 Tax=Allobaculum sp. Allo2 TaxID=2853432 RepID=UPI001F600378|nr:hypothetical protein [Allobaculum sp. Allo2]